MDGSALLTAVYLCGICAERGTFAVTVEASLTVLENFFLCSISSPFCQGRSAKMEIPV